MTNNNYRFDMSAFNHDKPLYTHSRHKKEINKNIKQYSAKLEKESKTKSVKQIQNPSVECEAHDGNCTTRLKSIKMKKPQQQLQ